MEILKRVRDIDSLHFERQLWDSGISYVVGVDEVGRGPLAGPVYACAVVFDKGYFLTGVRDSKELSEKKREEFAGTLSKNAISWSLGSAEVDEIDRFNIRQATFKAMQRAIAGLTVNPDYIIIDGEDLPGSAYPSRGIIKGDKKSFTIAAASIMAKVFRDNYMKEIDQEYPVYQFKKNKGYGTAEHIKAIKEYGYCKHHRRTFLKKIIEGCFSGLRF
jgi:ribonuclease HII